MWWDILVIGGLWFNLISIAWFCLLVFLIENDYGTVGGFAIFVGVAIVQLFSNFNIVGWMWANPWLILLATGGYFVIGACWGIFKWTLFARDKREKYDEEKAEWLTVDALKRTAKDLRRRVNNESHEFSPERKTQLMRWAAACDAAAAQGGGVLIDELKPAWTNSRSMSERYHYEDDEQDVMPTVIPHPKDHTARITRWMGYWPWSLFWTILNDPIRRICKWMYKRISVVLVSIGARSFDGTEDDFVVETETTDRISPE